MSKLSALKLASVALLSVVGLNAYASQDLPYMPHPYLYGYAGDFMIGEADILQPIIPSTNSNLFLYT
jgi:hypothetical protein